MSSLCTDSFNLLSIEIEDLNNYPIDTRVDNFTYFMEAIRVIVTLRSESEGIIKAITFENDYRNRCDTQIREVEERDVVMAIFESISPKVYHYQEILERVQACYNDYILVRLKELYCLLIGRKQELPSATIASLISDIQMISVYENMEKRGY